jgi:hypothetical protein
LTYFLTTPEDHTLVLVLDPDPDLDHEPQRKKPKIDRDHLPQKDLKKENHLSEKEEVLPDLEVRLLNKEIVAQEVDQSNFIYLP